MIGVPEDRIDIQASFETFRLNSIHAMHLLDELEDYTQIRISPMLFWEKPTLASFCNFIHSELLKSQPL
jgi:acyl carrier protein